jgi:hypothetical protein
MPGGYKLLCYANCKGKRARALAIYKRSGHVAAGHVPLPISSLYYKLGTTIIAAAYTIVLIVFINKT